MIDEAAAQYGLIRRRGESDPQFRERFLRWVSAPTPGSAAAIIAAAENVLPASVGIALTDGPPGYVMLRLRESWWRRLFLLARRDRKRVRYQASHQIAAGVMLEVK